MLEVNKKQVPLKSYSLEIRIDSVNQILKNKEKVKWTRNISTLTRITDQKIPCVYIYVYQIVKNWGPGPYNSLCHVNNRRYFPGLALAQNQILTSSCHLHLAYHFTVHLKTIKAMDLSAFQMNCLKNSRNPSVDLYGEIDCMFLSCHVRVSKCGFTLKCVRDMIRTYSQLQHTGKYSEHSSIIWSVWPFRLRTKWFWVWVQLQSLKLQIMCLLQARSSLTFRQLQCRFTLKRVHDMIRTYGQLHHTD